MLAHEHDNQTSIQLAGETNCVVLLVNYSLSPEVRFPVALEECYTVVSHATNPEHASKLRVDPTRVALGGDSAGGNLTAAVTSKLCELMLRLH